MHAFIRTKCALTLLSDDNIAFGARGAISDVHIRVFYMATGGHVSRENDLQVPALHRHRARADSGTRCHYRHSDICTLPIC